MLNRAKLVHQEYISQKQLKKHPYLQFGLGIYGFLQMLRQLIVCFLLMTLISIVQLLIINKQNYKMMSVLHP